MSKAKLKVCPVCGHHVEPQEMVVEPTRQVACTYCHENVLNQNMEVLSADTVAIARAIRAFRRPDVPKDTVWQEVVEGWEPLGHAILDHWYARPRGLKAGVRHNSLGWELSSALADTYETFGYPFSPRICMSLALLFEAQIELFLEDCPLEKIDESSVSPPR